MAEQQLNAIAELFAADARACAILRGVTGGLTAEEIRRDTGMTEADYDSARKRIRRTLLREGLTCARP